MNNHDNHAIAEKFSTMNAHLEDYNPKSKFWLIRKTKEFFRMEMPPAATAKEWREWRKYAKARYPIKYFIIEEFPPMFWWPIKHRVQRAYWWCIHRFHPKHRYHVIKPRTLEPGYYDARTLILHAQMDILADFYEYEKERGHVDWEADENHDNAWKEVEAIYNWWIAHQDREKALPDFPERPKSDEEDDIFISISDLDDYPELRKEWDKVGKEHERMEAEWERQEEEMINRLSKIRLYLWD